MHNHILHAFYETRIQSLSGSFISAITWVKPLGIVWSEFGKGVRVLCNHCDTPLDIVTVGMLDSEVISIGSISNGKVILAGTTSGMHFVWTHNENLWCLHSSCQRPHTSVISLQIDPTKSFYCVLYDTGSIEIRNTIGNIESLWTCLSPALAVAWSQDGRSLLVGFASNEVCIQDLKGNILGRIAIVCLDAEALNPQLVALVVASSVNIQRPILIAFKNGRAQLCDEFSEPVLLDTQSVILSAEWSPTAPVVALLVENGIQFYSGIDGRFVHSLGPPGGVIRTFSWSPDGESLAVVSGAFIYIAHIAGNTEHCMFGPNHESMCVQTGPHSVSFVRKNEEREEIFTSEIHFIRGNSLGCVVTTRDAIVSFDSSHIWCSSYEDSIEELIACDCHEDFMFADKFGRLKNIAGEVVHEMAGTEEDGIVSIACHEMKTAIARESGLIQILVVDKIVENSLVETVPREIWWNCDGTLLALLDGGVWIGTSSGMNRVPNRDHVVDFVWSQDLPRMFVCLDKHRLFVTSVTGETLFKFEEPIVLGHPIVLVGLVGLEVIIHHKGNAVEKFPTKTLRDMRSMLALVDNPEDIYQFASDCDIPVIWDLLAEHLLRRKIHAPNRIADAKKCFENSNNIPGQELVAILSGVPSEDEFVLEVLFFYYALEECEEYLLGNEKLLEKFFRRTKQWEKLDGRNMVDVDMHLARIYFVNEEWHRAITYFEKEEVVTQEFIEALIQANEYQKLATLVDKISDPNLLKTLGRVFLLSGMAEAAVSAYMRIPNRKEALSVCSKLGRLELTKLL